MYAIMHLNIRQDGSILALGFGSTTRPSDWRVRLDKKPTRCLTSAYLVILKREVIHFQVHGLWAAASWVQIGGGVNLRQVDAQNCSQVKILPSAGGHALAGFILSQIGIFVKYFVTSQYSADCGSCESAMGKQ